MTKNAVFPELVLKAELPLEVSGNFLEILKKFRNKIIKLITLKGVKTTKMAIQKKNLTMTSTLLSNQKIQAILTYTKTQTSKNQL